MRVIDRIVGLIRETSSSLPEDVERALGRARRAERKGGPAEAILGTILENVKIARKNGTPLCQDTGTLTFFVDERLRRRVTPAVIRAAVARATERGLLRKNALDSVSGKSYDDNCAPAGAPVIHYLQPSTINLQPFSVTLIMKGGGSENMSRQYSLPDAALGAGRDLKGVRACVLDAVQKAQGYGCAPGILGVAIGGDRATGYETAKAQLLRPLDATAEVKVKGEGEAGGAELRKLERTLLKEANSLGIGPMGLGGKTTLLGIRIGAAARVPASFFVTVAYMCWAVRRRTIVLD